MKAQSLVLLRSGVVQGDMYAMNSCLLGIRRYKNRKKDEFTLKTTNFCVVKIFVIQTRSYPDSFSNYRLHIDFGHVNPVTYNIIPLHSNTLYAIGRDRRGKAEDG